jgi:hypothetical protein
MTPRNPSGASLRVVSISLFTLLVSMMVVPKEAYATNYLGYYDLIRLESCVNSLEGVASDIHAVNVDLGSILVIVIRKSSSAPEQTTFETISNVYDGVARGWTKTTDASSQTYWTQVNKSGEVWIGCGVDNKAGDLVRLHITAVGTNRISNDTATPKASVISSSPNPFNGSTTISYSIEERTDIALTVLDIRGALVRTLTEEMNAPGLHSIGWDGTNDAGTPVASGTYVVRLQAGQSSAVGLVSVIR